MKPRLSASFKIEPESIITRGDSTYKKNFGKMIIDHNE